MNTRSMLVLAAVIAGAVTIGCVSAREDPEEPPASPGPLTFQNPYPGLEYECPTSEEWADDLHAGAIPRCSRFRTPLDLSGEWGLLEEGTDVTFLGISEDMVASFVLEQRYEHCSPGTVISFELVGGTATEWRRGHEMLLERAGIPAYRDPAQDARGVVLYGFFCRLLGGAE